MTDETVDLKKLVDSYIWQVNDVEKALTRLAQDASELTETIRVQTEQDEATRANLEALRRTHTARMSELETIKAEFGNAQLDGDVAEEQRIKKRKREIDAELAEIERNILGASNVVTENDHARRAAELTVTKDELEKRLPKKSYEMHINNPLLESVSKTIRADAERLRKQWNSISLPSASKEAMEEVRQQRGVKATKDSAWLVEQERKRQERLKRYEGVQGSTDAVAAAMSRPKRKTPQPSVTATTDADGRLSGDTIRAALAAKQST